MQRLWISSRSLPFWMTAFRSVSGKGQEPGRRRRSVWRVKSAGLYRSEPAPALSPSWALSAVLPSHCVCLHCQQNHNGPCNCSHPIVLDIHAEQDREKEGKARILCRRDGEDGSPSGQCRQVSGEGAHVQALKVNGHQRCAQVQGTDESERYSRGQAAREHKEGARPLM